MGIMSCSDVDTAFANLLQKTKEGINKQTFLKEVFYTILSSCSIEKHYNPFYYHLILRFSQQFKGKKWSVGFTLQLLFWDLLFQQFIVNEEMKQDDITMRRMANSTKLMVHLIQANILTLNILKSLQTEDWNTLPQMGKLCLTLLFTKLLETNEDQETIKQYIVKGVAKTEEGDLLRDCISMFLVMYMQKSPKYEECAEYSKNVKIMIKACQKKQSNFVF